MRRTIEITNLNGGSGVGVASSQLPMDLDYFVFYWVNSTPGMAASDVPDMKLYMNSDLVRQYTGTLQDDMNQVDVLDAYAVDNIMVMHLDQLGMKSITASYGTTMNTLSPDPQTGNTITNARVELTNTAGVPPTWRLFADVDDAGNGGPGFVERIKTYAQNNIGTGEKSYDNVLPFGTLDVRFWRRLYIHNLVTATTITLGRLLRASKQNEVFKRTTPLDSRILADYKIRQLSGTVSFLLDGTETGIAEMWDTMKATPKKLRAANGGERVMTAGLMSLRLTADAAGTVDITLDSLGEL